jgi:L-2,4-diaminobutyric acid acetyltransferase
LIRKIDILDLNSPYNYLLLCKFFNDTCVVARENGKIVGFVSAFRQPDSLEVIFVWQIAVDESQRGKGLGSSLLHELLELEECKNVRFLETTISPSNKASQALFRKLADNVGTRVEVFECFPSNVFPEKEHEPENLYRIGPF